MEWTTSVDVVSWTHAVQLCRKRVQLFLLNITELRMLARNVYHCSEYNNGSAYSSSYCQRAQQYIVVNTAGQQNISIPRILLIKYVI